MMLLVLLVSEIDERFLLPLIASSGVMMLSIIFRCQSRYKVGHDASCKYPHAGSVVCRARFSWFVLGDSSCAKTYVRMAFLSRPVEGGVMAVSSLDRIFQQSATDS